MGAGCDQLILFAWHTGFTAGQLGMHDVKGSSTPSISSDGLHSQANKQLWSMGRVSGSQPDNDLKMLHARASCCMLAACFLVMRLVHQWLKLNNALPGGESGVTSCPT